MRVLHKCTMFLVAVISLITIINISKAKNPLETAIQSTVRLEIKNHDTNKTIGFASGVFVTEDGWVITNKHVVENSYKKFNDITIYPTKSNEEINEKCSFTVKAGNIVTSPNEDIALIIPAWPRKNLPCGGPPSFISPINSLPSTGTNIQIIGYPGTTKGSGSVAVTSGQVAGKIMFPKKPDNKIERIQFLKVDAEIGPGSSGGPVINENGKLVAITSAMTEIVHQNGYIQKLVGLVIPTSNILEIFPEIPSADYMKKVTITDVSKNAWYSDAVSVFQNAGYDLSNNGLFRPSDLATRAEFITLIVDILGGLKKNKYSTSSFDDISPRKKYYQHFEEAGVLGLVKGEGNCYGNSPCFANPENPINRAEAAILLLRAFNLQRTPHAPSFDDAPKGEWYTESIEAVASLCILRGDDQSKMVRPADPMNRAEMIVMLLRLHQNTAYPKCPTTIDISKVVVPNAPTIDIKTNKNKIIGAKPCTQNAWECLIISTCSNKLEQIQKCTLINKECSNPNRAKPTDRLKCIPAEKKLREMLQLINEGENALNNMADIIFDLPGPIAQQALEIRKRFETKLNKYKDNFNSALKYSNYILISKDEIELIEKSLVSIEKEFLDLPGVETPK